MRFFKNHVLPFLAVFSVFLYLGLAILAGHYIYTQTYERFELLKSTVE